MTLVARRAVGLGRAEPVPTVRTSVQDGDPGVGASCLVAAAFIVLGAVVSDGIGLDSTLGAFVCGVIVASGRIVPVARLRPLRTIVLGVFAPLFLAVNGLAADLTALRDPGLALTAAAAIALAVASKSLGAYGGGRLAGLGHDRSMAVSSALNARGTVQLVVAAAGLSLGLITTEGFTILVLVALVSLGDGRSVDPAVHAANTGDAGRGTAREPRRVRPLIREPPGPTPGAIEVRVALQLLGEVAGLADWSRQRRCPGLHRREATRVFEQ